MVILIFLLNLDIITVFTSKNVYWNKLFFFLVIVGSSLSYSQNSDYYINSAAISDNINCGIGEIFIIQKLETKDDCSQSSRMPYSNVILEVYPNPTHSDIYIKSVLAIKNIDLYSLEGKLINTYNVQIDGKIDLSALSSGTYILKVQKSEFEPVIILKQ